MLYAGFCGPSNPSQSAIADAEQLVNWFTEPIQSPFAPVETALYPTPGTVAWLVATGVGCRAVFAMGTRAFAVMGTDFIELFATGTYTVRGTVLQDQYPATISYNGPTGGQLLVTSGTNAYLFVLSSNAFSTVLTGEATMGGMINSRFLAFNIVTGRVRASALNDGATWDGLVYFQRGQAPDPWQCMIVRAPEIWLFGEQTFEVWYDAGNFPQPFAPIPGAFGHFGIVSPFAGAIVGDTMTWVSRDRDGAGRIVAARGFSPQTISNYAVDTALAGYARASTINDAEVLVYSMEGHQFANFTFPSGRGTWTHDFSMPGAWHERGSWIAAEHRFGAWAPRVHGYAFGKHLVGDRGTGTIAYLDSTVGTNADGSVIRRLRIPPPLWASSQQRLVVDQLEVYAEAGLGLTSGQGSDPQMMLRCSGDGKTWSTERMASAGKKGEYRKRLRWSRCGATDKLFVPEITVTDPIPWRIAGAEVIGSGFAARRGAA